jgi:hypothetical protein
MPSSMHNINPIGETVFKKKLFTCFPIGTEGAKPGKVVKRKHTADDVIEQKRSYEGHCNRGFQGHWKNGRTWLTFENEN